MVSEPQEEWQQGIELAELFRSGKGRTGETASRSSAAGWPRKLALDGGEVTTGSVSLLTGKVISRVISQPRLGLTMVIGESITRFIHTKCMCKLHTSILLYIGLFALIIPLRLGWQVILIVGQGGRRSKAAQSQKKRSSFSVATPAIVFPTRAALWLCG
jgi:hypothetical protein